MEIYVVYYNSRQPGRLTAITEKLPSDSGAEFLSISAAADAGQTPDPAVDSAFISKTADSAQFFKIIRIHFNAEKPPCQGLFPYKREINFRAFPAMQLFQSKTSKAKLCAKVLLVLFFQEKNGLKSFPRSQTYPGMRKIVEPSVEVVENPRPDGVAGRGKRLRPSLDRTAAA